MRRPNRPKVHVTCPNCGKEEYVYAGRADHYVACSKACRSELTRKKSEQSIIDAAVWCEALQKPWLS